MTSKVGTGHGVIPVIPESRTGKQGKKLCAAEQTFIKRSDLNLCQRLFSQLNSSSAKCRAGVQARPC